MPRCRCVILEHRHCGGRHFDWLFEHPASVGRSVSASAMDPTALQAPLWAGRVGRSSSQWRAADRLVIERLADHRRRYLTAQGPLTGGRGEVRRVDRGWVRPLLWRQGRVILAIDLARWRGRVELRPLSGSCWLAQLWAGNTTPRQILV